MDASVYFVANCLTSVYEIWQKETKGNRDFCQHTHTHTHTHKHRCLLSQLCGNFLKAKFFGIAQKWQCQSCDQVRQLRIHCCNSSASSVFPIEWPTRMPFCLLTWTQCDSCPRKETLLAAMLFAEVRARPNHLLLTSSAPLDQNPGPTPVPSDQQICNCIKTIKPTLPQETAKLIVFDWWTIYFIKQSDLAATMVWSC